MILVPYLRWRRELCHPYGGAESRAIPTVAPRAMQIPYGTVRSRTVPYAPRIVRHEVLESFLT